MTALALRAVRLEPVVLAFACLALAARPQTDASILTTIAVGALGVVAARSVVGSRARAAAVTAAGCAAFWAARALADAVPPRATAMVVAGAVVAGIGEEALFRGALYERLERFGVAIAIAVPAIVFALIHVPTYGVAIVPLDTAAGALFGWQRWASGGWLAPAVTHVLANAMVLA